eukprot:16452110-Heterocapsa_arctica.AAC.1
MRSLVAPDSLGRLRAAGLRRRRGGLGDLRSRPRISASAAREAGRGGGATRPLAPRDNLIATLAGEIDERARSVTPVPARPVTQSATRERSLAPRVAELGSVPGEAEPRAQVAKLEDP